MKITLLEIETERFNDPIEELITVVGGFLKDFRLAESMSYKELLGTYQRIKAYVKG